MTLRIRGIEAILQKRGPLSLFLNLGSNFADISDAEFNFSEFEVIKQNYSYEKLNADLTKHYKIEAL
jgi:hypothetical protein